jgi:hypothetical protein
MVSLVNPSPVRGTLDPPLKIVVHSSISRGNSQFQPTESSTELLKSKMFDIEKLSNYNFKLKNITSSTRPNPTITSPTLTVIISTLPQPF